MINKIEKLAIWLDNYGLKTEGNSVYGLLKKVSSCDQPTNFESASEIRAGRDLSRGDRGPEVGYIQTLLIEAGFPLSRFGVDCIFGPETEAATKEFQADIGFEENGKLDSLGLVLLEVKAPRGSAREAAGSTPQPQDSMDAVGSNDERTPPSVHDLDEQFPEWSSLGLRTAGGSNFHKIDDGKNNYRSAIPEQSSLFFSYLKEKYGITNIVNLKSDGGQGRYVTDAGLNYLSIPMGSRPPSEGDWGRIKGLLQSGNTLIHCRHGADRTGMVVARWKIEQGLSSPEAAYSEAEKFGFKEPDHPGYTGDPADADPNEQLRNAILSSNSVTAATNLDVHIKNASKEPAQSSGPSFFRSNHDYNGDFLSKVRERLLRISESLRGDQSTDSEGCDLEDLAKSLD